MTTASLVRSIRALRSTGYTPLKAPHTPSPIDFFHPSIILSKSFNPLLSPPYPKLCPTRFAALVISYLTENHYLTPAYLQEPPEDMDVLINISSSVFSSTISAGFKSDMTAFFQDLGGRISGYEIAAAVFGYGYSIPSRYDFDDDDEEEEEGGMTLEGWIGVMIEVVCREYNRKMEGVRMEVAVRAAGTVEKSLWSGWRRRFGRVVSFGGQRGGWGVAGWVYRRVNAEKGKNKVEG
ncbi:hypothetical protein TWF481_007443 [Arthrobotrys musiformis]|uniref:LisH domain-containing protein n=1 Tax=Arthrobotrys musiformis TaxID=47236 RepID=A0AAV9WD36_9PEZI